MSNRDDLEVKLETLTAIDDAQVKKPHHIPIARYIQEAESLYIWVLDDKELLTGVGLPWELVEDLPVRIGAMKEAEAVWNAALLSGPEAAAKWAKEYPGAYTLRKEIQRGFRFAFRDWPDLLEKVKYKTGRITHAGMIQELINLVVLGEANTGLLESVGFDLTLLDKADRVSVEMRSMFAEATNSRLLHPEAKNIRDRAYTHLKEAVDKICNCGRYVFRNDKERLNGYRSKYLRGRNLDLRREKKKKKLAIPEVPLPVPPSVDPI